LKTLPTHTQNIWSKNKDLGNTQYSGTLSFSNNITHQPAQKTSRPARLVFDPGGYTFTQETPEDVHLRKQKTRSPFAPSSHAGVTLLSSFIFSRVFFLFIAETLNFVLFSSLIEDGQDFDPPGGVMPARVLGPKLYISILITSPRCPSALISFSSPYLGTFLCT
jgi:hypothetical protein